MINPKELRLGNLVKSSGIDIKVSSILDDAINIMFFDYSHEYVDCSFIDPIPITPEWLERFGFVKDSLMFGNTELYYTAQKSIAISNHDDDPDCCVYVHINHVHQLQNLFFALTGEELEVKE